MGIVSKLSECIASRGGNILGADVFVPEKKNVFYSRRYVPLLICFYIKKLLILSYFNLAIALTYKVIFQGSPSLSCLIGHFMSCKILLKMSKN